MADPFSIASGVAGIVSLGLTVYGSLHTYFSALKDRGEDVERACELLNLLGKLIEIIRRSAPTLANRYAQAADLVSVALRLCEGELQALERTIDKLNGGKSRWDRSKSAVAYPFNQTKLLQVQDRLFGATGVLGTVVDILIFRDNTCIRNDIDALKKAVQDNGPLTQDFLRRIQTNVEAIGSSVQPTVALLTEISTRVEEQNAMASRTHEQIQSTNAIFSAKLDSVAQAQAQLFEVVVHQSQAIEATRQTDADQRLRNVNLETKSIQGDRTEVCPRNRVKGKTSQQSLPSYRLWGGLTIFRQLYQKGKHKRGCRYYNENQLERSARTTFTYTGLRYILSLALNLTVERGCEDGAYSIKHSLKTYNMRETSKAFDLFSWDNFPKAFSTTDGQEFMTKLQEAYSLPDVKPHDVDKYGQNAAHLCIMRYGVLLDYSTSSAGSSLLLDSLETLLGFLSEVARVDIFVGENHNGSMLGYLVVNGLLSLLPRVYDVLRRLKPEFDPGFDQKPMWDLWDPRIREPQRQMKMFRDAFHDRPDIIEDLGYGELFLAISKRSESRLQELINSTNFTKYLDERDLFQHNVLHLCINWKDGLKLLLKERVTHRLANEPDFLKFTPLHYALIHSGNACYSADDIDGYRCSEAADMLLNTDCRVAIDLYFDIALEECSPEAGMLLFEHLKLRREQLRNLAMAHLPQSDLRGLGVTEDELPDTAAPDIWNKLQSLYKQGSIRELNDGLSPLGQHEIQFKNRQSIFHNLTSPRDAEMAFNVGFHGIDAPSIKGVTPILYSLLHHSHPLAAYGNHLIYADWLIEKGANLDCLINSLKLSATHNLARCSAWWARADFLRGSKGKEVPLGVGRVLSAVCHSELQSCLPCPCSPNELSRPLHYFFATALDGLIDPESSSYHARPFKSYPRAICLAVHLVDLLNEVTAGLDMAYMAKSIIHLLTMGCLGIRHLKWCHECSNIPEDEVQNIKQREEWDEVLEEDRHLINKLGKLTGKFEQEFLSQKVSIEDFLKNHWLKRMRQEWKKRKPLTQEQKRGLCEIGVTLESGCESGCGLYDPDFDDDEEEDEDEDDDDDEDETAGQLGSINSSKVKVD